MSAIAWNTHRIRVFLRRKGFELSWSRTHRLWHQAGLLVPRKRPRKRIASVRPRIQTPFKANMVWAYDFVFDTTATGDLAHSQKLLGHRNREMTEHYIRSRVGERVKPLR